MQPQLLTPGARVLFALLAALLSLTVAGVQAQSAEDFDPLFRREAGPFDVAVRWLPVAPQVGYVNVAVQPRLTESGEIVTDARVVLIAEGEDRSGVLARIAGESDVDFEVIAVNTPADPMVYRANLKFEEAGNWVLHTRITSPTHGEAEFSAPIVVLPAPIEPGAGGGWVFLGIVVVLSAGAFLVVRSIRKAQAARPPHPREPL